MEASRETIRHLARLNREVGMDQTTARNVSIMMDEEADMQELIRWIEANNPTAD